MQQWSLAGDTAVCCCVLKVRQENFTAENELTVVHTS